MIKIDLTAGLKAGRRSFHRLVQRAQDPEEYFRNQVFLDRELGIPHHLSGAMGSELENDTIMFIPGENSRANYIAHKAFDETQQVIVGPRNFDVYPGIIKGLDGKDIHAAAMPSHMGLGSVEIAGNELIALGLETLVRVGTSGPINEITKAGDIVIADYAIQTYRDIINPSRPSPRVLAAQKAAGRRIEQEFDITVHTGGIQSKELLYAEEFFIDTWYEAIKHALEKAVIASYGVLASEMEADRLFRIGDYVSKIVNRPIHTGAMCLVIGEIKGKSDSGFVDKAKLDTGYEALFTMCRYFAQEYQKNSTSPSK